MKGPQHDHHQQQQQLDTSTTSLGLSGTNGTRGGGGLQAQQESDSMRKIQRHSFLHRTLSAKPTKRRQDDGISSTPPVTPTKCCPRLSTDRIGQAVWCGRIIFVICLTALAAGLGYVTYRQQASANQELAESLFISMTDRALIKAVNTLHQKQWTITSMATVISHLQPNAESYPFVTLPSLQPIANDMRVVSKLETLGFIPIVLPEQRQEFQDHAYQYYQDRNFTMALQGQDRGIFQIDPNGTRLPDDGWSTWGSPYHVLLPAFEVESGDHPILMYNLHSDPRRGKPIDILMECVAHSAERDGGSRCTTISELIMSHKETQNLGPSSANWAPVFPANDPTTLVGITGSLIVWEELLANAFAAQVNGIDCVLISTQGEAFTYTIVDGVATPRGPGDLHSPQFDDLARSIDLTADATLFAPASIGYKLYFYPNQDLYETYHSGHQVSRALITAGIVGIVSLLFFLYDFFVRREFSAKKELLESKRKFMRFVSHEVRTPLNAVCMGLCVVRHEIAASLGYRTAEELQSELDAPPHGEQPGQVEGKDNINKNKRRTSKKEQFLFEDNDSQRMTLEKAHRIQYDSRGKACPTRQMAIEWFNTANDVLENTQSAVDVLSDLLNYDKVQSNTLTLELTKVPIWSLIESTLSEFRLPAMNKRIQFDITFQEGDQVYFSARDLPAHVKHQQVVGDEIRIQQVLRNLASNAVKFTPEGGRITIRASCNELVSRIHRESSFQLKDGQQVSLARSGTLEVVVEDSGVGMSPEQLQKVCSAGVQFNVNELQGGKGSGLGLFITKGIVEQHKGILTASSPGLGHGTKFAMTLPLYKIKEDEENVFPCNVEEDLETGGKQSTTASTQTTKTEPIDYSVSSPGLQKENLRVLVVDDIAANRKLLCRLLQINGHSYDEAEDGRVAVEQVQRSLEMDIPYDSVLLDFEMPVMNGPDAAKEIRKLCPEINIVGITGNMLRDDVALFKSCGANEVMGKPFKMQILEGIWKQHGVLAD